MRVNERTAKEGGKIKTWSWRCLSVLSACHSLSPLTLMSLLWLQLTSVVLFFLIVTILCNLFPPPLFISRQARERERDFSPLSPCLVSLLLCLSRLPIKGINDFWLLFNEQEIIIMNAISFPFLSLFLSLSLSSSQWFCFQFPLPGICLSLSSHFKSNCSVIFACLESSFSLNILHKREGERKEWVSLSVKCKLSKVYSLHVLTLSKLGRRKKEENGCLVVVIAFCYDWGTKS